MQRVALLLLLIFTVKDSVRGGPPEISFNCNFFERTIEVTLPAHQIENCSVSINCGNGSYIDGNNNCSLQNVWRYDSIPSNEELCEVTVSVSDTNDGVIYSDSAVCSFIADLGPPMITLNCSTDNVTGRRSINATWQLQSFLPSDILGGRYNIIVDCNIKITCGNGYIGQNHACRWQYGWRFSNIPLSEQSCNVTISYDSSQDFLPIYYSGSANCSFPSIDIKPKIQNITEDPIVGNSYEIQCTVEEFEYINFSSINWIGPHGVAIVNDSRINITSIIVGNNHTSILQFAYLKETDNGSYNCNVAIPNNTVFTESFMLKDLIIPTPIVSMTATNDYPTIGESFSIECNVTVAKGIVGSVEIIWIVNGTVKRRVTDTVAVFDSQFVLHRDVYSMPPLHANNNNTVYCCKAVIDAREQVESNSSITLTIVADGISTKMIAMSPTSSILTPTSTNMITHLTPDTDCSLDHAAIIISSVAAVMFMMLAAFLFGYCAYKLLIKRRNKLNFTRQEDDDTAVSTI